MTTITELNSKVWYRFLKVIFIIAFALSSVIAIAIAFSSVGNYQDDYSVKCNYGNKSTFLASKDKNIYISSYEDYTYSLAKLSDTAKNELQSACAISKVEMTAKMDALFNGHDDGKNLYELTPTKVITDTHLTASMWSLLSIVIIFVAFEAIRRAFYYIVLGSIKPEK